MFSVCHRNWCFSAIAVLLTYERNATMLEWWHLTVNWSYTQFEMLELFAEKKHRYYMNGFYESARLKLQQIQKSKFGIFHLNFTLYFRLFPIIHFFLMSHINLIWKIWKNKHIKFSFSNSHMEFMRIISNWRIRNSSHLRVVLNW